MPACATRVPLFHSHRRMPSVLRITPICAKARARWLRYNLSLTSSVQLDRLCVVLVATRNPLNLGAAARAMSNFGFSTLRVVRPYAPSFREARSAVGASELLANAEEFDSVEQAVADCSLVVGTTSARDRALQQPLKPLGKAVPLMRHRLASGRVAVLFGSEKRGLSNEDMSHCHWLLRIPTRAERSSMNLGQAVAVCLYEFIRESKTPEIRPSTTPARSAELARLLESLTDVLQKSGYLKGSASASIRDELRQMILRMQLNEADAQLWLGMLRKIAWKIRSGSEPS